MIENYLLVASIVMVLMLIFIEFYEELRRFSTIRKTLASFVLGLFWPIPVFVLIIGIVGAILGINISIETNENDK